MIFHKQLLKYTFPRHIETNAQFRNGWNKLIKCADDISPQQNSLIDSHCLGVYKRLLQFLSSYDLIVRLFRLLFRGLFCCDASFLKHYLQYAHDYKDI